MKKLNDNFENRWKEKFEDAEAAPAASVWDRIDASVSGSTIKRYKKKLFYYQVTAAASILLALLFGSYTIYNLISNSGPDQLVNTPSTVLEGEIDQTGPQDVEAEQLQKLEGVDNLNSQAITDNSNSPNTLENANSGNTIENSNQNRTDLSRNTLNKRSANDKTESLFVLVNNNQAIADKQSASDGRYSNRNDIISYHPQSSFNAPYNKPERKFYLQKKENPFDAPYVMPFEIEEPEDDPKKLWAGLMVSSGVFDPNISYSGSPDIMADASPNTLGSVERIDAASADLQNQSNSLASYKPEESGYNSEMSVSYGLDFGYKFSKKFVLFSGVGYQHNYGSTSVNTYIEPTESHAKYANHAIVIERASPESGLNSYNELNNEVQLNSTFEFVTIPVNFGYFLVDRKFKWLMTAGVSTDIFIKNSIDDSQNLFDPVQYKLGDDSPYNPIYFNGRFGTMVNYTFLKNYQLSLEPSYRIGLSELTSNNATFSSRPSSFMISAGIAYVFK
jgi:hypothetical protein